MKPEMLEKVVAAMESRLSRRPRVHLLLGSGFGSLLSDVEARTVVPFDEVPGLPGTTVPGHSGHFRFGSVEGVEAVVQVGRLHLYEGHDPQTVVAPVRITRRLGAEILVVTNAAGGISEELRPGSIVLIRDHLNLQGSNPLTGPVLAGEERFPDMTEAYDAGLRELAREAAKERGVDLSEGVYAGVQGPSFETPAEIRMMHRLGADVVGMSTVPEVIAARAAGMKCLGISLVTNLAAGRGQALSHADVIETAEGAEETLEVLLRGILGKLAARE